MHCRRGKAPCSLICGRTLGTRPELHWRSQCGEKGKFTNTHYSNLNWFPSLRKDCPTFPHLCITIFFFTANLRDSLYFLFIMRVIHTKHRVAPKAMINVKSKSYYVTWVITFFKWKDNEESEGNTICFLTSWLKKKNWWEDTYVRLIEFWACWGGAIKLWDFPHFACEAFRFMILCSKSSDDALSVQMWLCFCYIDSVCVCVCVCLGEGGTHNPLFATWGSWNRNSHF